MLTRSQPMSLLKHALLAVSLAVPLAPASAQAPRTVRIVVPLAPGGGADYIARLMAEQISQTQPVTMVTENRPGAGMAIGTEAVARAAPDGGTLLLTNT